MKECTKCKKRFPATAQYFYRCKTKSTGLRPECKDCRKAQRSDYYKKTRDKHLIKMREWYNYYKENGLKRDNITEDEIKELEEKKKKTKIRNSKKTDYRRKKEVEKGTLKGYSLKVKGYTSAAWRSNYSKNTITYRILKCTRDEFIEHLISTFEKNYKIKWNPIFRKYLHIDHVIPLCKASTKEELEELGFYKNTQFLYGLDNCIKSNKIDFVLETNERLISKLEKEGVLYERLD